MSDHIIELRSRPDGSIYCGCAVCYPPVVAIAAAEQDREDYRVSLYCGCDACRVDEARAVILGRYER